MNEKINALLDLIVELRKIQKKLIEIDDSKGAYQIKTKISDICEEIQTLY